MALTEIIDVPSPNHGPRRRAAEPDMVVLHYTGMATGAAAVERLCDPIAEVSAHYVLDIDGSVLRLVAEDRRAWHAGAARWGSVEDVNSHSIGIEIVNPGHFGGYPPFPEPQMVALEQVLSGVLERWTIPPERVVSHACVAPARKIDPGEKLDWRRLTGGGLAIWLDPPVAVALEAPNAVRFAKAAARIGYDTDVPCDAQDWNEAVRQVWAAAAMRFLREKPGSAPSAAGIVHLEAIAARWPVVDPTPLWA